MAAAPDLHPAQNRGLRELVATTRHLTDHWSALAQRFERTAAARTLKRGAASGDDLIAEIRPLMEARGLYGGPAAQSVGKSLAGSRSQLGDRFLERNQALRTAVLDVQHVATLLGYQAQLAETRGDAELARALRRNERKLLAVERVARKAAVDLGKKPDKAVERVDGSPAGRVAHGAANAVGTVGEWVDRRSGGG
ncbi:MAG TPA: hypothetical protein VGC98_04025 [Thermoleophilaceae bacterium]